MLSHLSDGSFEVTVDSLELLGEISLLLDQWLREDRLHVIRVKPWLIKSLCQGTSRVHYEGIPLEWSLVRLRFSIRVHASSAREPFVFKLFFLRGGFLYHNFPNAVIESLSGDLINFWLA